MVTMANFVTGPFLDLFGATVYDHLKVVKQAQEKGAGSWLSVILLEHQGFTLTKSEFRNSLALRYNRPLRDLP